MEHPGTFRNIPEHPGTSRNIPEHQIVMIIMRKKYVNLNFGLAHVTIWSAHIGHVTLCVFSRTEQLCFEMNAYGRPFHRGKSIEKYMRSLIIDDILSGGGNVSTEYYPGRFRAKGSKYKESGVTNFKRMEDLLSNGRNLPLHAAARGQPKRLARLNLVQLLIKCRPQRELTRALKKISRRSPRQQLRFLQ